MATSILGNIANMFRPVQQVAMTPQPNTPNAPALAQNNPGAGAPPPPAGTSQPTIDQTPADPLAELQALWQTDPKLTPEVDPLSTPLFKTDPAAIATAAGKIDFVGQLPPELLQKVMAGNDPQALVTLINAVAQRTLATSTQLTGQTIEQAAVRNNARIQQTLPNRVKQIQLDSLVPDNSALQHPASQPFLKMMRSQIAMNNPGMSAVDINSKAEAALSMFANAVTQPPEEVSRQREAAAGTDWEGWANLGS
jgi:hypothetical protein